ncbi:MAG TPA: hypothetical protein GYA07_03910 [Verrucomicrobia bacterium]|nr:hypothetical protein [Verrucomicrobiota bacterium]HOB33946.1 hypothetical protein [Verrucomicrobiota bacterium]HOP98093.1 hypothetical protein [Verrucomicrobiota bacterium]HPU56563.1 hypothetical protein [Verrucomicrobiota bacterium]
MNPQDQRQTKANCRRRPLRAGLAVLVALATDAIQIALGPFGWTFADEILDVIVMLLTSWLIGFHPLLLPTFVLEVIPGVDMFPTWTACVLAVIAMRSRRQTPSPPADVIDV